MASGPGSLGGQKTLDVGVGLERLQIRDALADGCDVYDLRGITDTVDEADPHAGLIRFKVGTGAEAVEYAGEWDLPISTILYTAFDLYLKRRG